MVQSAILGVFMQEIVGVTFLYINNNDLSVFVTVSLHSCYISVTSFIYIYQILNTICNM